MNGATAARVSATIAPGVASIAGLSVPTAPAIIAVLSAFLVRAPLIRMSGNKAVGDISITLLAMLGAFVTVADRDLGAGISFWTGVAFGSIGSGIIEIGKSSTGMAAVDRFKSALAVLFNAKEPKE